MNWLISLLLRFTNIDTVYKNNREKFLQAHARDSVKHYKAGDLEKAFITQEGVQYYRFPKSLSMGLNRIGMVQTYITWMCRGIAPVEQDMLIDAAEKALTEGLTKGKGAAKIGAILHEMRQRREMTVHTELIYNFLAIQYIREGEDPEKVAQDIHDQKIKEFKQEVEVHGNTGFFFAMPELKTLLKHLSISEPEWELYWNDSTVKQAALKKWTKSISSPAIL